jgi:uncharacterized protein
MCFGGSCWVCFESRESGVGVRVSPVEGTAHGVRLRVKAVPRASRSQVAGRHGDSLRIRLAAPPVGGAANDELIRFLADTLAVPRAAICVVSGQASRSKVLTVDGIGLDQAVLLLGL